MKYWTWFTLITTEVEFGKPSIWKAFLERIVYLIVLHGAIECIFCGKK